MWGMKLDILLLHEKAIYFNKNLQPELTKKFLFTVSQFSNNVDVFESYLLYDGLWVSRRYKWFQERKMIK